MLIRRLILVLANIRVNLIQVVRMHYGTESNRTMRVNTRIAMMVRYLNTSQPFIYVIAIRLHDYFVYR